MDEFLYTYIFLFFFVQRRVCVRIALCRRSLLVVSCTITNKYGFRYRHIRRPLKASKRRKRATTHKKRQMFVQHFLSDWFWESSPEKWYVKRWRKSVSNYVRSHVRTNSFGIGLYVGRAASAARQSKRSIPKTCADRCIPHIHLLIGFLCKKWTTATTTIVVVHADCVHGIYLRLWVLLCLCCVGAFFEMSSWVK